MDSLYPHAENGNPPEKQCTGPCGRTLPATAEYFYSHKECKDGLRPECKECVRERVKAYRLAHAEECRAFDRDYKQSHAEELRIKQRVYREMHPDQKRAWDKAHAERLRDYRRIRINEIRTSTRNRYARKKAAQGTHTAQDIRKQYDRQKGHCYYCGVKLPKGKRAYHVDHVVPLCRGGSNGPENLVIACPSCNQSKGTKLLHEWIQGGRLF